MRQPWIPGVIIAGTYYGRGRKEFWNTHFRGGTTVFDLKDADYTRIVVDVENTDAVLFELRKDARHLELPHAPQ